MARERLNAEVVHETAGRVRLQVPSLRDDHQACARLKERLSEVRDVDAVQVRPTTGSVIVTYNPASGGVGAAIQRLFDVQKAASPPPPVRPITRAIDAVRQADHHLMRSSEGRLSLADTGFVLLCVGAAVQLGRGRLASPATSLLWSAFALASRFQTAAAARD